jgi:glycosyltransferase involved in cell wall biosynthesis
MRILVDYRAALRARTGVGEYIHQLARAYARAYADEMVLFTSSWKDRPDPDTGRDVGASVIDRRIPVRLLNLLWHRTEWPPIESLAGGVDVAHSAHPLLLPARRAAQVITIHDLFFLSNPERTHGEIRRDYPALAARHARRADAVITSTEHARALVSRTFEVPSGHIYVCPPGPPVWRTLGRAPNVPRDGHILFVGTLEPRKNVGVLLDAYEMLLSRLPRAPRLVLAGRATPAAAPWLARLGAPPLAGRATHLGYVADAEQESLYAGARVLVLPSLDEGFGLPALAAMSAGVPVIASRRGSLPEVVDNAGTLVDPEQPGELAAALEPIVTDDEWAFNQAVRGLARARAFTWTTSAATLHRAYEDAVARRRARASHPPARVAAPADRR